jgi:IS605 OrfB family transposase
MAALSNTPGRACTYRLACPVAFHHRRDEWAVQAGTGPVRYDISYRPDRNRWYLDASWQTKAARPPALDELRRSRALGVDLNAEHLACWVLDSSGNPIGTPHPIALQLDALSASTRDGRLRSAIAALLRLARTNGCRSIVIEDLDLTDARQSGRETLGRGRHARRFRKAISGMPTRRFRTVLAGMAVNAGLWVIAVDPGWTSKWGQRYWLAPLSQTTRSPVAVTRHHAAAVVIARRGRGVGARRRQGVTGRDQKIAAGELPARPDQRLPDHEGPGPPGGQRAAAVPCKTRPAERISSGTRWPKTVRDHRAGSTSCSTP